MTHATAGRVAGKKAFITGAAGGLGAAMAHHLDSNIGPLRILVIDDNADIADTIGWLLNDMGHQHRLLLDGRMALDVARDFQPDAVLLDIGMPSIDGYAVCRAFREDPSLRHLPIIAQTGWGQEADKAASARVGFDYHLVKPVGYGELQQALSFVAHSEQAQAR